MLIQLPAETWIEILNWLRRHDLVKKLDKLWDSQFTPIVQDWLHKFARNVSIGILCLDHDGLSVFSNKNIWEQVPFAEVELPENIVNFASISIRYLDSNMLAFLRRMRPLFHNLYLDIDYVDGGELPIPYRTVIQLLMPLIGDQIESIDLDCQLLPFLADNYPPSFRLNARLLCTWFHGEDGLLINWLFTRHEDGQPRTLILLYYGENKPFVNFCTKVRQRFLDPARELASPFFIRIDYHYVANDELLQIPSDTENARTGERLIVQQYLDKDFVLITSYCPSTVDLEWLAKKKEEVLDWSSNQQRNIFLEYPTIGPIDVENQQQQQETG